MPEQKCLKWPTNLLEDKRHRNKSIYVSDFCTRNKRIPQRTRAKTKETTRYAKDIVSLLLIIFKLLRYLHHKLSYLVYR